jgi:hypothetical protein
MASNLHDLIPGLREAEEQYRAESFEAFAGVEPRICKAFEILPLTPRMFLDLEGGECGFVVKNGRDLDERDIALLLWRCSPYYVRGNDDLRRFHQGAIAILPYVQCVGEISDYLRRSLAGMPLWKGKLRATPGVGIWASRLVHLFAKEYGWSEDQVLDMPFRRLWQYANRILEDKDATYKEQAPAALDLRAKFLARLNAVVPVVPGAN